MGTPQDQRERDLVRSELQDFDWVNCRAWKGLQDLLGTRISQEELLTFALVLRDETHIQLPREYQRRKQMLIKWFDMHWDRLHPEHTTRISIKSGAGDELNNGVSLP
jgi:hypothetical protein